MTQEEWKGLIGDHQQEILATSPDGQREILAAHYTVNGATPSLQYEQKYLSIKLKTEENSFYCVDALFIDIKTYTSGKEKRSICLGVLNKQYPDYVTNYAWTTEKNGLLNRPLNQTRISSETLKKLKGNGVAVISTEAELPEQIDVEEAVNFWFTEISQMIKNPQRLTNADLSVAEAIVPFFSWPCTP